MASLGSWFDGKGVEGRVDLSDVLGAPVLDAVVLVVGTGALVSLSLSRDGGAVGATVTADGRWRREWFRDADAMTGWLHEAAAAAEAVLGRDPASSDPGSRQRPLRPRQKAQGGAGGG